MFEHFTTPDEIFVYKLGAALTMEYDSLEMLGEMEETAMRSDLKDLFHEHARETRGQIDNLQQCFALLGQETNQAPSPTTKGLAKEVKSFIGKTDTTLMDAVVLAGALETEHYETAVYETLIIAAKARGIAGITELLSQNLLQEKAAIEKIKSAADAIARENAQAQDNAGPAPEPAVKFPPYLPPGSV